MMKIGFIDYYIDEWHANNYPAWIRESAFKDKFDVCYAWALTDKEGGMTTEEWCRKYKAAHVKTVEELIEKSDCLVVLSPDNPEKHEELCRLPLMSGKPVYVDKTFAPDLATAKRIFEIAEKSGTPMFSSSALRFSKELAELAEKGIGREGISFACTHGPGLFCNYSVHQLEILVSVAGAGAKRIMQCGTGYSPAFLIDYGDGRRSMFNHAGWFTPFQLLVQCKDDKGVNFHNLSDFFPRLIDAILSFFETGKVPVPKEETLEIMALIEAGRKALEKSDIWIDVVW